MQIVELNPAGNFDPWEPSKLNELKNQRFPESLGQKLLFENEKVLLWELDLVPGQRHPFRKISRNHSWVTQSEGLAISRCCTGKISMLRFKNGDSTFFGLNGEVAIHDLENIGESNLLIHITEFKSINTTDIISNLESS
jgi:hypothetical protein